MRLESISSNKKARMNQKEVTPMTYAPKEVPSQQARATSPTSVPMTADIATRSDVEKGAIMTSINHSIEPTTRNENK